MRKSIKKSFAILSSVAFATAIVAPVTSAFAAATTYKATSVGIAKPGGTFDARVLVEIPQGAMNGDTASFRLRLPRDMKLGTEKDLDPASETNEIVGKVSLSVPEKEGTNVNEFATATVEASSEKGGEASDGNTVIKTVKPGEEYEFTIAKNDAPEGKGILYIDFTTLKVPTGSQNDIKANFESQPGSVFERGAVTIATVGTGSVDISIDDVQAFSSEGSTGIYTIRVQEDRPGALKKGSDSLKLKLPQGFKWDRANISADNLKDVWGNSGLVLNEDKPISFADDDRTLSLNVTTESTQAAYITLENLAIIVDESLAKVGDVSLSISGKSSVKASSAVIAQFGDYSTKAETFGDTPTLVSGRVDNEMGKIVISESLPGSLNANRTITLTLPENARWNSAKVTTDGVESWDVVHPTIDSSNSDENGLELTGWSIVDSDARMLKVKVNTASSTKPAKIVLEKGEISLAPNFKGDLKVEVGGTAIGGTPASLTLGKVVAPVSIETAAPAPEVKIGIDGQAGADLILTESIAEGLKADTGHKLLRLELPDGVSFTSTPKFEVVEGDISLETQSATTSDINGIDSNKNALINVRATSSKPSKIKVSNIKLRVDRTVPEGDILIRVRGNGTSTSDYEGTDALSNRLRPFAASTVALTTVAKVGTPAPAVVTTNASFKIGDTKYTTAGVEKTMDVAPYIKDGRTFMPIRYVADALGITEDNIHWNGESGTVTLLKNGTAVQVTVGSAVMVINGAAITMDVAPEIADPGRVMLPIKWIANAFGAATAWDEATQTVTVK